ncbi:putative membrane protein [Nonomuraea solani]|uniref:Putative membrane protein n=1 Tax=Nonomuraea solani TaxID=1144553 RepID=A0A1H6EJK6_9ACTN|nr:DUF4142 domain-containing protein [Nonomuraea solani]SEG97166.1 putative membrane protein [Nonomuraea solani]
MRLRLIPPLSLPLSLAAVALAVLPGCGADVPQDAAALAPKTDAQPSEQDKTWMRAIHQGNLAEVQAGRLAKHKGVGQQVEAVGEMLVKDHTKLDAALTQAATRLGVQLPTSPSAGQRQDLLRMEDATGEDFDQDFLSSMIKAHKAALAATKTEISKGSSPAVVALAKTAAPSLQEHLSALRRAQGD